MKPVWVFLSQRPFQLFNDGVKRAEVRNLYRKDGSRNGVASTVQRDGYEGRPVNLRWGYGAGRPELKGTLGRVWVALSWGHLPVEARRMVASDNPGTYIDVSQPVVAFEVRLSNGQCPSMEES